MSVYLNTIFITAILGGVSTIGRRGRKPSLIWILAILGVWSCVYAFRYNTGSDFVNYYHGFTQIGTENLTFEQFSQGERDMLFSALEYYSYQWFDGNWIMFAFVLAVLTYLPILLVIRDESPDVMLSALLFIFTMEFFSGYNGTRQAIAVNLSFFAYHKFFKQGKYIPYALILWLAVGFHSTALLVIPFHFLSRQKLSSDIFKIVVVFMLLSYVFLWEIWDYLIEFLEMIGQTKLAEDYADATESGSGFLRFAVRVLPAVVGLLFLPQLKEEHSEVEPQIMLILISGIFMLFSTKYWLFARVAAYFNMNTILFLPKLKSIFTDNSKVVVRVLIAILYFAYMYTMLLHGDGGYLPYTFFPLEELR